MELYELLVKNGGSISGFIVMAILLVWVLKCHFDHVRNLETNLQANIVNLTAIIATLNTTLQVVNQNILDIKDVKDTLIEVRHIVNRCDAKDKK